MDAWDEYDYRKDSDNDRPGVPITHSTHTSLTLSLSLSLFPFLLSLSPSLLSLSLSPLSSPSSPFSSPSPSPPLFSLSDVFGTSQQYIAFLLENSGMQLGSYVVRA